MLGALDDWIKFSFRVWLAYLTAQVIIFVVVLVGGMFLLLVLCLVDLVLR